MTLSANGEVESCGTGAFGLVGVRSVDMGAEERTIRGAVEGRSVGKILEVLENSDGLGKIALGGVMATCCEIVHSLGNVVADAGDKQKTPRYYQGCALSHHSWP